MKDKIHLVISIATLSSGGAERVVSILSYYLANRFEKVTLILWKDIPHFYSIDKRIEIITIPDFSKKNNTLSKLFWFRKYIKKNRPDVILSFLYPYSLRVIIALLFVKSKIIAAERRDPRAVRGGYIVRLIRDLLYTRISRVFVQSKCNKNLYPVFLRNKIDILYNPILLYNGESNKIENCNIRKRTIVTVGRLIPEKNHKLLLDAFKIFKESHPDFKIIIWGGGSLKNELLDYTSAIGLRNNIDVEFPGACKTVHNEIANATAFVLSSKSEGMPNALYEAICMGIPSISTRVTGVMDILQNEKNVLLVNNNAYEISKALSRIADDKILSSRLTEEGKSLYKFLNPASIAENWINAILKVIKS